MLYVNADDWGRSEIINNRTLSCFLQGRICGASAMTFMNASEDAAELALKYKFPVGLHLNLTQEFASENVSQILRKQHYLVASYLKARKINQILYNPFLKYAFDNIFLAQWDEFCRLYGEEPNRLDGHHHMHLCMNMIASGRYPKGLNMRRNFTFDPGEKDIVNRLYRSIVDTWLVSRFNCSDYFFSIAPIDIARLQRIVILSKSANVELMVHPGVEKEYIFLISEEWLNLTKQHIQSNTKNN
jgi:chitin disaccharide deacetylase